MKEFSNNQGIHYTFSHSYAYINSEQGIQYVYCFSNICPRIGVSTTHAVRLRFLSKCTAVEVRDIPAAVSDLHNVPYASLQQ